MTTHVPEKEPFKRINFFPGFFTTAKDWNDGETYHLEKRKLHNRGLHSSGVLFERDLQPEVGAKWATDFRRKCQALQVMKISDSVVKICKGAALDCNGNLIYLPTDVCFPNDKAEEKLEDKVKEFQDGDTIYIALKFREKEFDRVEGEFPGYKRQIEEPEIVFFRDLPTNEYLSAVRLASFTLKKDATRIGINGELEDLRVPASAKGLETIKGEVATLENDLNLLTNRVLSNDEKRRLHNRGLHSPGVFNEHGQTGDKWKTLQVTVSGNKVKIAPGIALDCDGNLICLPETGKTQDLPKEILDKWKNKNELMVFVSVKFRETLTDEVTGEYQGFRRWTEDPEIVISENQDNAQSTVLLATLTLKHDGVNVTDKREPASAKGLREIADRLKKLEKEVEENSERDVSEVNHTRESLKILNSQVVEDHLLHSSRLHTPGILYGLEVEPDNGLGIKILLGSALDAKGRLIKLRKEPYPFQLSRLQDGLVYIVIEADTTDVGSDDMPFDFPPMISYQFDPPGVEDVKIELARILTTSNTSHIVRAQNENRPGLDEIDCTHVRWAGAVNREVDRRLETLEDVLPKQHDYHMTTLKQHNRGLHTPGVFNEYEQSGEKWQTLRVSRVSEGKVMVAAGAALDNNGNLLFFSQDTIELPNDILSKCEGDKTVYVALKFDESLDSTNASSLATNSKIEFLCDPSDVKAESAVGLARLKLSGDATHAEIEGFPEDIRESASVKGLGKLKEDFATLSRSVTLIDNQAARNHEYYREHNRALYTVGVFNIDEEPSDRWETLRVTIKPGSERAVTVARGFALDSNGNVLYHCDENPIFLPRDIADICTGDKTVYVALKFDDSIRSSDISGLNANAKIVFLCDPSDVVNNQAVALATIKLSDTKLAQIEDNSLKDQRVSASARGLGKLTTKVSELTKSLAKVEAQVTHKYEISDRETLERDLEEMRESFGELAWKFPTRSLDDVRHAVVNLEMSIHSQMMTEDGLQAGLSLLYQMIEKVPDQFTARYQKVTDSQAFKNFKKECVDDSDRDKRNSLKSLAKLAEALSEVEYSRSPDLHLDPNIPNMMTISTGSTDATLTMRFVTKDHGTP